MKDGRTAFLLNLFLPGSGFAYALGSTSSGLIGAAMFMAVVYMLAALPAHSWSFTFVVGGLFVNVALGLLAREMLSVVNASQIVASPPRCGKCKSEVAVDARYCPHCAYSLLPHCPRCKKDIVPGADFCAHCRHSLVRAAGAAS